MQLQERTLNTAVRCVNAVDSVGPAGKAAEGLCSRQNGAVGSRCRLCSDARMYQTTTSGLMAGSAGEAAVGVVQPANAGASVGAQAVRDGRAHNQRFIYPVFTKDTLDEKGQARDTSTHVTFNALNSTKNSPVAAG